jgi:hypothetical protein
MDFDVTSSLRADPTQNFISQGNNNINQKNMERSKLVQSKSPLNT